MARLLSDLSGNQNHQTNSTDTVEADGSVAALDAEPPDDCQESSVLPSCSRSHPDLHSSSLPPPRRCHTAETLPSGIADHITQHQNGQDGNISLCDITALPVLFDVEQIGSALAHGPSDPGPSRHNTFAREFSGLSKTPQQIPKPPFTHQRLPIQDDFQGISLQLSYDIIPHSASDSESGVRYIVLVLHDYGESEKSLAEFTKNFLVQPETAYLLLRAQNSVDKGYTWFDGPNPDRNFLKATQTIIDIIHDVLVLKCSFSPRDILLFGQGQGGLVALTVAAAWREIELGGVMSIAGPIPLVIQVDGKKIKTPALVIGGSLGNISAQAEQQIRDLFLHVDVVLKTGFGDFLPKKDEIGPVDDFFAHRLRREEWTKQAVLTLDGGGIRGYGTLLILQDLMRKIEKEERRLDIEEKRISIFTTSSFHPGMYKPREIPNSGNTGVSLARSDQSPSTSTSSSSSSSEEATNLDTVDLVGRLSATPATNHPASTRYLPCHYFDYCGGTSTGGLIAIMLSRLRMSVDDCLFEYERLAGKIFGKPRPLALGAILWHKYSGRKLEKAIRDVTRRHGNINSFGCNFPLDEDLCRTAVIAFDDSGSSDTPYLFRTYNQPRRRRTTVKIPGQKGSITGIPARNRGDTQLYDIVQVGRSTSAAPTYFTPNKIEKANGSKVRFKDGGFGCNNPSVEIYNDVAIKHGEQNIGPFLSLGTGEQKIALFAEYGGNLRNALANFTAMRRLPASTRPVTRLMEYFGKLTGFPFFRFDGGTHLGSIKMDDWHPRDLSIKHIIKPRSFRKASGEKTLQEIRNATTLYLADDNVQRRLKRCARLLVRRRRLRTRDASAWERYALASHFICPSRGCRGNKYLTVELFAEHIREHHRANGNGGSLSDEDGDDIKVKEEELQRTIDEARCCWLYNFVRPDLGDEGAQVRDEEAGQDPTEMTRAVTGLTMEP